MVGGISGVEMEPGAPPAEPGWWPHSGLGGLRGVCVCVCPERWPHPAAGHSEGMGWTPPRPQMVRGSPRRNAEVPLRPRGPRAVWQGVKGGDGVGCGGVTNPSKKLPPLPPMTPGVHTGRSKGLQ